MDQKSSKQDASNSPQPDDTGSQGAVGAIFFAYFPYQSSATFPLPIYTFRQCADGEASGVILIKDEDDIRGCGATEGKTVKCGNMA